jgi:hypothetical protein
MVAAAVRRVSGAAERPTGLGGDVPVVVWTSPPGERSSRGRGTAAQMRAGIASRARIAVVVLARAVRTLRLRRRWQAPERPEQGPER